MREKWQKQMPLMPQIKDHTQANELTAVSDIIDAHPIICDRGLQDLNKGKLVAYRAGADGMSANQVLRCAIVKILFGFTYEDLAFHIVDSQALSWFCRIGIADKGYKKSALNKNIKAISDITWERINTDLLDMRNKRALKRAAKSVWIARALKPTSTIPPTPICCGMVFGC